MILTVSLPVRQCQCFTIYAPFMNVMGLRTPIVRRYGSRFWQWRIDLRRSHAGGLQDYDTVNSMIVPSLAR